MGKLYMGFDAGTQSVKVAVYDEQFRLVTSRSLPTSLTYTTTNTPEYSAITKRDTTTQHDILLGLRCMSTDPARDFRVATCAPGGVFETMIIFVSPYSLV